MQSVAIQWPQHRHLMIVARALLGPFEPRACTDRFFLHYGNMQTTTGPIVHFIFSHRFMAVMKFAIHICQVWIQVASRRQSNIPWCESTSTKHALYVQRAHMLPTQDSGKKTARPHDWRICGGDSCGNRSNQYLCATSHTTSTHRPNSE